MLEEAIGVLIGGEVDVGKKLLRKDVVARASTSSAAHGQSAAERRMLSRTGNPQARNLLKVIRVLQEHGASTEVRFKRRPAEPARAR